MKVRNIVRKAAVLGSSAVMLSATMMGALAYNLADYPDQYIADGQFDGVIVVGERAATSDVLGSVDIAASLQANSVTQEEVEIEGQAGEVSLTGDAFKLETSSDLLEIREVVGEVYDTLTDSELEALRGGTITTDEGSTDYNQYLRFADDDSTVLQKMGVNYAEDEDDTLGDYLIIDDNLPFFEWEIEFSEGLESATTGGQLDDLEDEVFNIFGTDFTFVDSSIDSVGTGAGAVTLEFMAGDVSDTLREGETKTYTIDGVDYEVTAVFISDPSSGTPEAKFAVNGELTDSMTDGDTDTLSNGLQIGVRDLLVNSREGVVEFFLGANKIEFTDSNTASESFASGVEISNENIEDAQIAIIGGFTSADNSTFEITSIKYRLSADAKVGSTIYVPAEAGAREFLDEPEGLLSPTFDVRYEGLKTVTKNPIELNARSDHSYDAVLSNLRGKEYDFPLLTDKGEDPKWGDEDDDFWFCEPDLGANASTADANILGSQLWISDDDYFVVSEGDSTTNSEKDDSAILRYEDIDTSDRILTFSDMSNGESKEVSYQTLSGNAALIGKATNFVVEGNSYTVWVGADPYPLAISLNGDSDLDGACATFTVKGGGVVSFDETAQAAPVSGESDASSDVIMSLTTPANQFDDSGRITGWNGGGGDRLNWTVDMTISGEQVDLTAVGAYDGPLTGAGTSPWGDWDMINDNDDDDYDRGLTDYGADVELHSPSGSDDADELTIYFPESQVGAQVFVVAGVTERSASGAGGVVRDVVNPIAVGLAVLDKDAPSLGDRNMIIVGGPNANTVAFDFLGSPSAEEVGQMFEPGKAMIVAKEYGDTVATLVAGYEAQETLGASYVLADYSTYLADVEGSEVEVIATDLSDLQVAAPSADMGDDMGADAGADAGADTGDGE